MDNEIHKDQAQPSIPKSSQASLGRTHVSTALYMREFDYVARSVPPTSEVLIAAIPRSGSTAFCLDLWRTGILGAPLEYLNFGLLNGVARWTHCIADQEFFWNEIQSVRTSPNGVFSYKAFVQNYRQLADSSPALLGRLKPSHVIYITREDILAQAISYATAALSGYWFAVDEVSERTAVFDTQKVKEFYMSIRYQMACWEQIFSITNTSVFRVTYEEYLRSPSGVTQSVADYVLGHGCKMMPVEIPSIRIQRNARSAEWIQKLRNLEPEWSDIADGLHAARRLRPRAPKKSDLVRGKLRKPAAGMLWSPERQVIYLGKRNYVHQGSTNTSPTHDLAHLLVGFCSDLPWLPEGDDRMIRLAEYNAVLLENLLIKIYSVHMRNIGTVESAIAETLEHMKWFVGTHYAPFPLPLEEALTLFNKGIDIEKVTDCCPHFFDQAARQSGSFMSMTWGIQLFPPGQVSDSIKSFDYRRSVQAALSAMCVTENGWQ